MSIVHHPDDSSLVSYAAGNLAESAQILIACHLQHCPQCRQRVEQAELLGGALLSDIEPQPSQRDAFLSLLEAEPEPLAATQAEAVVRQHALPSQLHHLLEHGDRELNWSRVAPGIKKINLSTSDGGLKLLKIAPGVSMPQHSHNGSELTLILKGAYEDEFGCFRAGDVADLDPSVEHQPVTQGNEDCICLIAMDAPLKFKTFLPKLMQPFMGF